MKRLKLYKKLFERTLIVPVPFNELRNRIILSKVNHFDVIISLKDSFRFDFMSDGIYSDLNLHRMKLFYISSERTLEENNKTLIFFRLNSGALIGYAIILSGLISIPFWSGPFSFWNYPIPLFIIYLILLIVSKVQFEIQFDRLQYDLREITKKYKKDISCQQIERNAKRHANKKHSAFGK